MASSLFGNSQRQQMPSNPFQMFQQIQDLSRQIGNGNPEQIARDYAKKNGIPDDKFNQVVQQAQGMAQMFQQMGLMR